MIRVDKRLQYVFKNLPHQLIHEPENKRHNCRLDKLCYVSFKGDDVIKFENDDDWDLVHLDGDISHCALDNLELVVFEEEDTLKIEYETKIKNLKNELSNKNSQIKQLSSESKIKDGKVDYMYKQVQYEQGRVKELNKEIRKQEKEIRRLLDIISSMERVHV